ncbi:MAG: hypothetical protein RL325_518 [Planctomycetota bacterium]
MGFASFLRNFIGAAPQDELDAVRAAVDHAAQARAAAEDMKALVAQVRDGHLKTVDDVRGELLRLSQRVESMPEMRAQLETFVHSLGRTMTGAAERLDQVDNRIERLEQQARSQTELIALTRTEFDKQGRVIAGLEGQMRSLEDAITRIVAAADRSSALMREIDERRARASSGDRTNRIVIGILVVVLILAILK